MSNAMSWTVIIGTVLSLLACFWLIVWTNRQRQSDEEIAESESHVWDEDVRELNNPLPMWWLYLFVITLIGSGAYLVYYPGLGNFAGVSEWSQEGQYEQEVAAAEARYGPIFARYGQMSFDDLANDTQALGIGQSLYANYCAQCHGSTGRGAPGFPNLVDTEWLYGGAPEQIEQSILKGRNGIMPSLSVPLGANLDPMIDYVRSMADSLNVGSDIHTQYVTFCSACHGVDGGGNQLLGGPSLVDDIWLYGSSEDAVRRSIVEGRNGVMPAHEALLGADRSRILAAFVHDLAQSSSD